MTKEQEYKSRLEVFIEPLKEPWKKAIREADRTAMEIFREARSANKRTREEIGQQAYDQASQQYINLFREEVFKSVSGLFNCLAEAFCDHEKSRRALIMRIHEIRGLIETRPELGYWASGGVVLSNSLLDPIEAEWKDLVVRHGTVGTRGWGRAARLRRFKQTEGIRPNEPIAKAAEVSKGDVSNWSNKRPGEPSYVPDRSATAKRIEDVLNGTTPIDRIDRA